LKIVVFVSGRGSNLRSILTSAELKGIAEVKAVISDKYFAPLFKLLKVILFLLTPLVIKQNALNIRN
jgi:folate-dependent phosphoribosylglycinamide formyltransferase PurN